MRRAPTITVASLLLAAACAGSKAPPEPPPPEQPYADAQASADAQPSADVHKPDGCADAGDCASQGGVAVLQGDARGLPMLEYACAEGAAVGCQNLSTALRSGVVPEDAAAAYAAAKRGCELGNAVACAALGIDESLGLGGARQDFASAYAHLKIACDGDSALGCRFLGVLEHGGQLGQVDDAKAMTYFEQACDMGDGPSCFSAGVLIVEGAAGSVDLLKAQQFMTRACEADDEGGCAAAQQIAETLAAESARVPNANLRIGSATVDGLTVNALECRVTSGGGGMLGNMVLLGAIAKRKSSIDKCGKPGAEVEIRWTASGGKITKAEGEGTQGACVAKTLLKLATPVDGECAASIVLGP